MVFSKCNPEELDKKITATLVYLKRFPVPENNIWTIWAFEVVDGSLRKNSVPIFLDEILHQGNKHYTKKPSAASTIQVKEDFKEVKHLIANSFNQFTNLRGTFRVDYNKADESLGLFYVEHK